MSMTLLFELQTEIRRLFIAGSELAIGDFKLKKLLPGIQKMGKSAAVLNKIAISLEKLIGSEQGKSGEILIQLSTILNAVLYTQCGSDIKGETKDIKCDPIGGKTCISLRKLKPVIEALTSKGSGRLEIIEKAYEEGIFKDIRLVLPAINALEDVYVEIGAFVHKNVLPQYGKVILPMLEKSLDIEGGKADAYRLQLIYKICGENYRELYLKALEIGSAEVKISAINALKNYSNCEDIFLEKCNDKKKDVRKAIYYALAEIDSPIVVQRLVEAFKGKDSDIVLEAVIYGDSSALSEILVIQSEDILKKLAEKNPTEKLIGEFAIILDTLQHKKHSSILHFLKNALISNEFLFEVKSTVKLKQTLRGYHIHFISQAIASVILSIGTNEAYEFLESIKDIQESQLVYYSFAAAVKYKTPEQVFDTYSKYVIEGRKLYSGKQAIHVIERLANFNKNLLKYDLGFANESYNSDSPYAIKGNKKIIWDKRWIDVLMDLDEDELVYRFAYKGNSRCIDYMLSKLAKNQNLIIKGNISILLGMVQADYSEVNNVIIDTLRKTDVNKMDCFNYKYSEILKLLPSKYAKDIEEVTARATYHKYVKEYLMEIANFVKTKA